MTPFNLSATLNALRILKSPTLLHPQLTIPTFDHLPIPLSTALKADIRAVILDKDNCFAVPYVKEVYPAYKDTFEKLRKEYGDRLLIVSNSAGTDDDGGHLEADILEKDTRVKVLRHSTKKPGCYPEIMSYLTSKTDVTRADQVAIVGDRLFTDVLMANMMGSWAVWVKTGVVDSERTFYGRVERGLLGVIKWGGGKAPVPIGGVWRG
ncbi:HAD-superfamily phosphatase [Choiromyces venosus 120613-1]|uniref:HAD-superfamily phosphatase n=1 Tax=Choiromyces venosus 120613-1 TaxID=1336337 RepID=A0A3N4J5G6_9PEZI|nr:HAD-superfamily phosphatase [Choiromyces venosus 120613-1]